MSNNWKELIEGLGMLFFKSIGLIGFYFFIFILVIDPSLFLYLEYLNGSLDGGMYSNQLIIMTFMQIAIGVLIAVSIKKLCKYISNEITEDRNFRKILTYGRKSLPYTALTKLTVME